MPSASPTRAFEQSVQTATNEQLNAGDTSVRAFGNVFDVRTLPGASTLLVTGLEIYSSSKKTVEYEVYTREGTWEGTEGDLSSFTLIASGTLKSIGQCGGDSFSHGKVSTEICEFAPIPPEEFQSVPIKGNGGVRSFYVTLKTREMLYRRDAVGSEDGYSVLATSPEIEVLEGAGVLQYPYSKAQAEIFYKRPRGFMGKIIYIRNPCLEEDGEPNYEWPCPTRAPVTAAQLETVKPTQEPTTGTPTLEPTTGAPNDGNVSRRRRFFEQSLKLMSLTVFFFRLQPTYEPTIPWDSRYTPPPSPKPVDTTVAGDGGVGHGGSDHSFSVGDGGSSPSVPPPRPPAGYAPPPDDGSYTYVAPPEKPPPYHPGAVFVPNNEGRIKYSGPGANDTVVVLQIGEVQKDRFMQDREIEKYCDVVFEFLKSLPGLERANVHVLNVQVHYQESLFVEVEKKKKKKKVGNKKKKEAEKNTEEVAKGRRGQEVEVEAAEQSAANETDTPDEMPPAYLEVTTIITTINSILPPEVTSFLINDEIESNAAVLAEDLFKWRTFYGVFLEVDSVSVRLIDKATGESLLSRKSSAGLVLCVPCVVFNSRANPFLHPYHPDPPTLQPTTYEHFLSLNATLEDDGEAVTNSVDFITLVGFGVGMMWALLTLFSLRNIWTARKEFKRENMLRNDTNASKVVVDPRDEEDGPLIPKNGFEKALMAAQRTASILEKRNNEEKGEPSDPEIAARSVPATADPSPELRASFAPRGSIRSKAAEADTYTDRLRNVSDDGLGALPPRHPDYVDAASTRKQRPSIFDQSMCSECSDHIEASERSGGSRLSALLSMAKKPRRLSELRKKRGAKPAAVSSRRMTAATKEVDSDSDSADSWNTSSDDSVTDSSGSRSSEPSTVDNVAPPAAEDRPRLPKPAHGTRRASMSAVPEPLIKVPADSEPATRRNSEGNDAPGGDLPPRRISRRRSGRKHGNLPERKFGRSKKKRTKSGLFIVPPDVILTAPNDDDAPPRPVLSSDAEIGTILARDPIKGSAFEQVGRPDLKASLKANTGARDLLTRGPSEGSAAEEEDQSSRSDVSEIDQTPSEPDDADLKRDDPSEGSAFKREAEGSSTSETSSNVTKDHSDGGFSAQEEDHQASSDSLSAPMDETARVEEEPDERSLPEEETDPLTLRFDIGQTVYCKVGPNPITDWKKGKVAKLWHRESSWPPDMVAPYKVKLGKKKYIFAPRDSDDVICLDPTVVFC